MHSRSVPAAMAVAALLCGCGSVVKPPARHKAGAEPAVSPAPGRAPAGRQVRVGDHPEGIVVDPQLGLVAVATRDPADLTVISARTGAVLRRIPTGGAVRHLGLLGRSVLVPNAPENRLQEIDIKTGALRTTAVGREPHDAAGGLGRVFVADEFAHAISVIEPDGTVRTVGGFVQPGGVVGVGDDIAVVDVGGDTLTLIDARTLVKLATVPAGAGPTHVAAAHGDLFVTDTRGNRLLEYAVAPRSPGVARAALRQIAQVSLPGKPYGIAADPSRNRVWVTLTGSDELVELDADPLHPGVLARYPTAQQPNTVAVDPRTGEVYVADADPGTVELIEPGG